MTSKNINSYICTGLLYTLLASNVFAGGLDSSYFPDDIMFGKDRFFTGTGVVNAKVEPAIRIDGGPEIKSDNIIKSRFVPQLGYRYNINDTYAFSLQYQQPFEVETEYKDGLVGPGFPIQSKLDSNMLTASVNIKKKQSLGSFLFTGGLVMLDGQASFSTDGGLGLPDDNFYVNLDFGTKYNGFFGLGYEIPEYALRVNAMFYPEIKTVASGTLRAGDDVCLLLSGSTDNCSADIETPETTYSPNRLVLQARSGISPKAMVYMAYSFVQWSALPKLETSYVESANNSAAVTSFISSPSLDLFDYNSNYFLVGMGYQLHDKVQVYGQMFFDKVRSNPVDDFRIPSRGAISYALGSNYEVSKKISFGLSANYIAVPKTDIVTEVNTDSGSVTYTGSANPDAIRYGTSITYTL